jgi:hypothetical protein
MESALRSLHHSHIANVSEIHEPPSLGLKGVLLYIFVLIYHGRWAGAGGRFGLIGNSYQTALFRAQNAPKTSSAPDASIRSPIGILIKRIVA